MLLSEILDKYAHEKLIKAVDRQRGEIAIKNLTTFLGQDKLADLDDELCGEYAEDRDVSDSTIRRELTVLKAAVRWAWRKKRITLADIPVIELPPESAPAERWLTKDELRALAAAADDGLKDFIDTAYFTASRKTAIIRLTRPQVDLGIRRINLALPNERKTCKRRPIVPIDPLIFDMVKNRYQNAVGERLFPDLNSLNARFKRAVGRAGLTGRVTPHTLRHSRATHLLQSGTQPYAVAQLLGDNLATVLRVYGHHCPNYLAETINSPAN